jgi:hypothetical protein
MNDVQRKAGSKAPTLAGQVGAKAARKLKARRNPRRASGLAWA